MFPLKDENPTSRTAWMTWLILATNVAVFGWELWLKSRGGDAALTSFMSTWAFDPSALAASPLSPGVWLTVLTSMFLHSGWVHIGGNMLYLAIFANNVEGRIGPLWFLAFYLCCGAVAALVQAAGSGFAPVLMLGASGAIAGVLGAYLLLFPRARVLTAIWVVIFVEFARLPAWVLIGLWFLVQLGSGLASLDPSVIANGGVAYLAHVGGFLAGMALITPVWLTARRRRFVAWR
ncbi:MAG TPA: rhomboid family intramembrane serine protease [Coriobacteriia bacterium]